MANIMVQPSLEEVQQLIDAAKGLENAPTLIPLCASISSEFLTPSSIYLKISAHAETSLSFLFESAATTETIGRYSFIGADPRETLVSGPAHGWEADPLPRLDAALARHRVAHLPALRLPPMTGGAIGYVGYDCVRYFEPRTRREDVADVLHVPESLFMLFDTIIAVDHFFQRVQVITYLHVPSGGGPIDAAYASSRDTIARLLRLLRTPDLPLPPQGPIELHHQYCSNIGEPGYRAHVATLKRHIRGGDIIQAVPSQRIARPTSLHPFNIYRHLRSVNPSPYLFYVSCPDFHIVGASPELLVKKDPITSRIITHPIAGTVKRGTTPAADEALAASLRASLKDRAEHVMLVDLARNDVNRVCDPRTTRVDTLMVVQKFSHVQHLVSEVSGQLREGKTRFDAFRSIFPAGTVSGAPKVRAMELIAELEREKRGIYAGAVGYWGYNTVDVSQISSGGRRAAEEEGAMDTCIALRTMLVKDGVAYLQAGGGIVFDSDEREEYEETMNKAAANMRCIEQAERLHWEEQQERQKPKGCVVAVDLDRVGTEANGIAREGDIKVDLVGG